MERSDVRENVLLVEKSENLLFFDAQERKKEQSSVSTWKRMASNNISSLPLESGRDAFENQFSNKLGKSQKKKKRKLRFLLIKNNFPTKILIAHFRSSSSTKEDYICHHVSSHIDFFCTSAVPEQ